MKKEELTRSQLLIMKCIWDYGQDIPYLELLEEIRRRYDPRYNRSTMVTFLLQLEEKGYVAREKQGRGYLYTAVLTREEYLPVESRSALGRMFGGSAKNLVAAMAETNTLTDAEIDELADFLEQLRREGR